MDFKCMTQTLNDLLSKECPETFNSTWIFKRAPRCYRYIWKNVRTDYDTIDWDQVTSSLEWKFQRRWTPRQRRFSMAPYHNKRELRAVLKKHRSKLYVFISPQNRADRNLRDVISIALVRLAQRGNESAKQELIKLIGYTIDDWLDGIAFYPAGGDLRQKFKCRLNDAFAGTGTVDPSSGTFSAL